MNLPLAATQFLEIAKQKIKKGGIIHFYENFIPI